jgi:sulfur-carrier protein adenylyltransferase/sulfurtransferase
MERGASAAVTEQDTSLGQVLEMAPTELKERMDLGQPLVVVDVREPFERVIADLPEYGQRTIPIGEFLERMDELDPDDPVVLYCRTGGRSQWAAERLVENGHRKVWNLAGGVMAWRRDVDPSLREY